MSPIPIIIVGDMNVSLEFYGIVYGQENICTLQDEYHFIGRTDWDVKLKASDSSQLDNKTTEMFELSSYEVIIGIYHGFLINNTTTIISNMDFAMIVNEIFQDGSLLNYTYLLFHIFHDLWRQKWYVTFGSKFGANFLIYDCHPYKNNIKVHAKALILVKEYEKEFPIVDIASMCRVGKMVKKKIYLASVKDKVGHEIIYVALDHTLFVSNTNSKEYKMENTS